MGRQSFAAVLGRGLADDGQMILDPGALRRLDRVKVVVIDGSQYNEATAPPQRENARTSPEYAAIGDQLPFYGGRPREEIEAVLRRHGLINVTSDPLEDLVAAQVARMVAEGGEPRRRLRYVAWGDVPR